MTRRAAGCAAIETDLVASAVGETDAGAEGRVRAHVAQCRACEDELARYRAVDGAVTALRRRPVETVADLARARERLESRLLDLRSRLVAYRVLATPLGTVLLARSEQGVVAVEYLPEGQGAAASRLLRAAGVEAVEDGRDLETLGAELGAYVEGRRSRLDWPLDLRLARSAFHRAVLEATAAVPYGAVVSYKRIAGEIGRPEAVRAVAQALRWNPVPLVVPCHRVVGTDGSLTGYAGGKTALKRRLLAVEGVPIVRAGGDFGIARDVMYVLMPGDREYCLPTCPEPDRLRSGLPTFFASRARAEAVGLAPCTACRPDLHPLVELD